MSIFDPESMMFTTDWSPLEKWFEERAKQAGKSVYQHHEVIVVPPKTEQELKVDELMRGFSREAGKQIAEMFLRGPKLDDPGEPGGQ